MKQRAFVKSLPFISVWLPGETRSFRQQSNFEMISKYIARLSDDITLLFTVVVDYLVLG